MLYIFRHYNKTPTHVIDVPDSKIQKLKTTLKNYDKYDKQWHKSAFSEKKVSRHIQLGEYLSKNGFKLLKFKLAVTF